MIYLKIKELLKNQQGVATYVAICIAILITFIIGGILIAIFSTAFQDTILPGAVDKLEELLNW